MASGWQPADPADRVWNRAALQRGGTDPGPADRALANLLRFHGLAMNGGVLHAFDCLDDDEIHQAIAGFEFFGLTYVADLLRSVPPALAAAHDNEDALDELEHATDARYLDDSVITAAFEQRYADHAELFAPIL